ncbi:MAG: glycosyltransferase family 2 protein [Candidatus Omnitrophota bacterium]|nr:MAG: glycosyltransferase family 2 protein [Candidatus Omnitrophota bacterium]
MPKERLSVVIITKDEEERLARCLESVRWADEIVVVDDLSTDRTAEICRQFGAKVISHKSEGNFDRQRNIGIDNANGEWILQMDADEVVSEELKEEIKRAIASDGGFAAYKIKRKNFFLGHFLQYGGWFLYYIKLFRKHKARYVGRSVHETLRVDGEIGQMSEPIKHFPFSSIEQFIERQNFYSSVEARLMYEDKGRLPKRMVRYNLTVRPLKLFWKLYIKKKGFRDGMYGLLFAALNSWTHFLRWAKYWEIYNNADES